MIGPVAILLAAGHGKRMRSDRAKVLHEVCGRPMISYVVDAVRGAGARTIVVVVGAGADQVRWRCTLPECGGTRLDRCLPCYRPPCHGVMTLSSVSACDTLGK